MSHKTLALLAVACAFLQGCFFFFIIPGSVTGKISDAVTGAKGANCVSADATVGSRIRMPDDSYGTVKSLTGTSSRCTDERYPIRAEIVTASTTPAPAPTVPAPAPTPTPFESNIHVNLSAVGWQMKPVPENLVNRGGLMYAIDRNNDLSVLVVATPHDGITDLMAFAQTRQASLLGDLTDATASQVSPLTINGRRAFRYTISGKDKTGQSLTYLITVIEGPKEVALLNTWTFAANFDRQKEAMAELSENVEGFKL